MTETYVDRTFESMLGGRIREYGNVAVGDFEPSSIARNAISGSHHRVPGRGIALGRLWTSSRLLVPAMLALLILALAAAVIALGYRNAHRLPLAPAIGGPACDVLDPLAVRAGATDGGGWPRGLTRLGRAVVRPGLLAGWADFGRGDSYQFDVVLLDPVTGSERRITHFARTFSSQQGQFEWAPDGSAIAMRFDDHHQCNNTYVLPSDDSLLLRPIRDTQTEWNEWFAWAPDASAIAMVHGKAPADADQANLAAPSPILQSTWAVWLVQGDGSPTTDLGSPCEGCLVEQLLWSPDGRALVARWGGGSLAVADPASSGWTPLFHDADSINLVGWLDDRTMLAVREDPSSGRTDLMGISLVAPTDPRPIEIDIQPGGVALSPDRSALLLTEGTWAADGATVRTLVRIVDLTTKAAQDVWSSGSDVAVEAAWSPDNASVAISAWPTGAASDRAGVWILDRDGSHARRIRNEAIGLAWQPVRQ